MGRNPNPCTGCTQCVCDYRRCDPYKLWLNGAWKEFRRNVQRGYWDTNVNDTTKFTYLHPDLIRRYLREGPCNLCDCAGDCDIPCAGYWRWWEARMIWLKWLLEKEESGWQ